MKIYKTNKQRVLYLNSTNAIKTTNSSSKNTYFSWNVPDVVINELATLQVGSIGSQGTATDTKIYTFRITGVCSDNTSSFSSDGGPPILFSLLLNNYNSTFTDNFKLYLMPQVINNITLYVSDDITNKDSGIATSISFMICLVIEEIQIEMNEIGNPYADAISQVQGRYSKHQI